MSKFNINSGVSHAGEETALLDPQDNHHGLAGGEVWGSTFNLCNSAIGAGILSLPYAVSQVGLVLGLILIFVMAVVINFTEKILIWTNRMWPHATSYEKLVECIYGKRISMVVIFCVIFGCLGTLTGFLVIIADLLTPILQLAAPNHAWLHSRLSVVLALSVVGVLPLASLEKFNSLRFSSTIAIFSVVVTVGVIIYESMRALPIAPETKSEIRLFIVDFNILNALPLITFAFGCHLQLIPIFAELKDNHIPSRPNALIRTTNLICVVLYSITGVFGYLQFPGNVESNILKNYANNNVLANIARCVLSFVIVCHYPPTNYVCRAALENLAFPNKAPSVIRRLIWTVLIWAFALTVSIAVPNISVVFGLMGATTSSLIIFLLPALFLLKYNKEAQKANKLQWEGTRGFLANISAMVLIVIGLILGVFGTVVIILTNWFPHVLH